ncbi:hypothetical protein [Rhodobium gokarnense]|uniref:Uncharacterized protein n=1 Tax=Rhodobium gokarnense TaxID=364296 RepID=A0ABT3HER2_9HYPH|nr:hypothetical protein [Rhodobium gokarnense]MCW2308889.1 hypothetical protein [Rhodobium gokarnense]
MDKATVIHRLTQIRKVENVSAVPPGAAPSGAGVAAAEAEDVQRRLEGASNEAKDDLRLLQEAGWTFGAPEQAPPGAAFDVLMDADGHLKLAGRALVAKIDPTLDRTAVEALLSRTGMNLRRELGFAPNTFLLEAQDGSALNAARTLNELQEILYAEPSLVEPIQSRED